MMMIEHFLIAGAQRSGTTYLYQLLDQHPEIEMLAPLRPEPKYFLSEPCSAVEYERLFTRKPGARVHGEKSTSYMDRKEMPAAAAAAIPGIKAMFLLREPVSRAISNYCFSVENGIELEDAETALREGRDRQPPAAMNFSAPPFAYLSRGHYYQALERWERILGRDRIHLIHFEQLIVEPAVVVKEAFRWLGVSADFDPILPAAPVNSSHTPVTISDRLRGELAEHFRASNRILAERYQFDVSAWQQ